MLPSSLTNTSLSSSSSPSSPSSSSPVSSPTFSVLPPSKPTMEEVWKDITITSLPNTPLPHTHTHHHNYLRSIILQDFLNNGSAPQANKPPPFSLPCSRPSGPGPISNSPPEFQFLDMNTPGGPPGSGFSALEAFDALASSSGLPSFAAPAKNRASESDDNVPVDRRHKRMIKNRESAARSRARKQAYVVQLEGELEQLRQENARLKRQQQQLLEAPPPQLSKKHALQRTSTAPF